MIEKKNNFAKGKWKTWAPLLINAVAGLGFLYVLRMGLVRFSGLFDPIALVQLLVYLVLGVVASIHIHEMGHCLLGRLFGYQLISYRVGVFAWNYENGRMRFSILRNRGYGGLCAMLPPQTELTEWQQMRYFGGGLLANYATVFLAWTAQAYWITNDSGRFFLLILGGASLFLAVNNSLPLTVGNNLTDGAILLGLILKKPAAEKMVAINELTAQLAGGIRPKDLKLPTAWPVGVVGIYDLTLLIYRYFQAVDNKDTGQVVALAEQLELSLGKFPELMLPSLYYELCFVAAISGNAEKAAKYYQRAGQILQRDEDVNGMRVKAYYAWHVHQDPKEAVALARQGLKVAPLFPLAGLGKMEAELLTNLIDEIHREAGYDLNREIGCS